MQKLRYNISQLKATQILSLLLLMTLMSFALIALLGSTQQIREKLSKFEYWMKKYTLPHPEILKGAKTT